MKTKNQLRICGAGLLILAAFSNTCRKHKDQEAQISAPARGNLVIASRLETMKDVAGLQIQVDSLAKTVSLSSSAGPDQGETGAITAALSPYTGAPSGYLFSGNNLYVFLQLKGTGLNLDVVSTRVQLTGYPAGILPGDTAPAGSESKFGAHLIAGYDGNGKPYYDYGDFYSLARANVYNSGQPSSTLWCLAFDLAGLSGTGLIQGEVYTRLPESDNSRAKITIPPYLNNLTSSSVTVMWETDAESDSTVYYGLEPSCPESASGGLSRFQAAEVSDRLVPVFNLFVHRVSLSGLTPGKKYYYQVRSAQSPSEVLSFQSLAQAPLPSFQFAVVGDTRTDDLGHLAVIKKMASFNELPFYIHLGDFADNFSPRLRRSFFEIEQPLAAKAPIFPVRGNHEDQLWYQEYFDLPLSGYGPSLDNRCYSFKYQNSYFIFVDGMLDWHSGTISYNWLQAKLAEAYADPDRKFTFLFSHSPFYIGYGRSYYDYYAGSYPLAQLAPLFQQYDLSAGFGGHIHMYERLDVSGRPFITSGSGGTVIYYLIEPDSVMLGKESTYSGETVTSKAQAWRYEFLVVEVESNSFRISAYDNNGLKFDEVTYTK